MLAHKDLLLGQLANSILKECSISLIFNYGFESSEQAQARFYGYRLKEYEFFDLEIQRGQTKLTGPMSMKFGKRIAINTDLKGNGHIEDLSSIFFELPDVYVPAPQIHIDVQGFADHLVIDGHAKIQDISVFGETFDAGEVRLGFDRDFFTLSEFSAERYFGGNLLARGSYPSNKENAILKSYSQIYQSELYKGLRTSKQQ